jgi:hypothetical protein
MSGSRSKSQSAVQSGYWCRLASAGLVCLLFLCLHCYGVIVESSGIGFSPTKILTVPNRGIVAGTVPPPPPPQYSPAQAIATKAQAPYSACSQSRRDCASEETSEAVKVILGHYRRERLVLLIVIALLLSVAGAGMYKEITTTMQERMPEDE